jgi:hypothetical protein
MRSVITLSLPPFFYSLKNISNQDGDVDVEEEFLDTH